MSDQPVSGSARWLRRPTRRSRRAKRLLVASVYAPSERNAEWVRLQLHFLRKTVASFDHAVYLNRTSTELFGESIVIGRSDDDVSAKIEHSLGLNAIMAYIRAHPEYGDCLILDSDAFPIREGWLEDLLTWMRGDDDLPPKQFAAAVRVEKMATFPHPCAFFVKGDFLKRATFDFMPRPHVNLAGQVKEQPGSGISMRHEGKHVFLPLLRTNVHNPHPVLAGIYGDLFYHHGSGSRQSGRLPRRLRRSGHVLSQGRSGHVLSQADYAETEERLYTDLIGDPEGFISQLRRR